MLSKDLAANAKAVNIIGPSNDYTFFSAQATQLNYSSSTDSSSFSTTTASVHTTTLSPMIRQPSNETNPGLSFFCQPVKNKQQQQQQPTTTNNTYKPHASFEKIQSQPLVISRINLTHRRPTTDLEDIDTDETISHNLKSTTTIAEDSLNVVRLPSFKTGFGLIGSGGGAGLASFMLRGNISQVKQDDARVSRKVNSLKI